MIYESKLQKGREGMYFEIPNKLIDKCNWKNGDKIFLTISKNKSIRIINSPATINDVIKS